MKTAKCTGSQEHWYVTTRKPTICPGCGNKIVKKFIYSDPSQKDFMNNKINYPRS